VILRIIETVTELAVVTKITASPMAIPFATRLVIASVEQIPRIMTKVGLSRQIPLIRYLNPALFFKGVRNFFSSFMA